MRRLAAALALFSAACAQSADLIVQGGPIHLAGYPIRAGGRAVTDGMAIRDGRVIAVGQAARLRELYAGPATRILELGGRPVYPGFQDAHLHLAGIGFAELQADLMGTRSYEEMVARARAKAEGLPADAWVQGRGWDQNDWVVKDFPVHGPLSAALPERPCALRRVDGHALLANAAAMRAARVSAATRDPEGGRILRDARGEPTGVFVDAAMDLIGRAIPPPSAAEREDSLLRGQAALHARGITGAHDAGVGAETIALAERLARAGRLQLRLHLMLDGSDDALLESWFARGPAADLDGGGRVAIRAVKLYADGALGSRGALLLEDYADEPGHRGLRLIEPSRLDEICARAFAAGFQVCTHAIGDGGNRMVLDAYQRALGPVASLPSHPRNQARWRVEHAQILHPEDAGRFAALGVIASMQTQHQTSDMPWAGARLGPERERGAYAWRWLLDSGARFANGSDAPVERLDPIAAYCAAVHRRTLDGEPLDGWHPEQRMTPDEALLAMTSWAAWAGFREDDVGDLAPGCHADFVILSEPLLDQPPAALARVRVLETWFAGERVYRAD